MRIVILVVTTSLALSCADSPSAPNGQESLLGAWELRSIQLAGEPAASVDPGLYTADFTTEGRVSARADCNQCSGSYSASGASLDIGVLACTRAYCGDESLFDEYTAGLDGATSFEHSGADADLVIRYAGGTLRFFPKP
ncbi:MAG TPA: META domain-containing protein [Vicinamibacteria bacterium]|nr:META domain-containing protein [Vicinamibacteria bacterium]